jgi:hypothetical protein
VVLVIGVVLALAFKALDAKLPQLRDRKQVAASEH